MAQIDDACCPRWGLTISWGATRVPAIQLSIGLGEGDAPSASEAPSAAPALTQGLCQAGARSLTAGVQPVRISRMED